MAQTTVINLLLDASGSMQRVAKSALKACSDYLEAMKKEYLESPELGKILVNLQTFTSGNGLAPPKLTAVSTSHGSFTVTNTEDLDYSTYLTYLSNMLDITELELPLDDSKYRPSGGTPLFDVIPESVNKVDEWLIKKAGKPTKTTGIEAFLNDSDKEDKYPFKKLCIIQTDGEDTTSKTSKEFALQFIKEKEDEGWTFVWLGAGADGMTEAASLNIHTNNSVQFDNTPEAYRGVYNATVSASKLYRSSHVASETCKTFYSAVNDFDGAARDIQVEADKKIQDAIDQLKTG